MTILQAEPSSEDLLPFIDDSVRRLYEAGLEAAAIVVGPEAYARLREEIGSRYGRTAGVFRTYQHVTIILDPLRANAVCVLPHADEVALGVAVERI